MDIVEKDMEASDPQPNIIHGYKLIKRGLIAPNDMYWAPERKDWILMSAGHSYVGRKIIHVGRVIRPQDQTIKEAGRQFKIYRYEIHGQANRRGIVTALMYAVTIRRNTHFKHLVATITCTEMQFKSIIQMLHRPAMANINFDDIEHFHTAFENRVEVTGERNE